MGSLSQEPFRAEGARDELQRPEHRRTATSGRLTTQQRAVVRMARARWAEELVADFYRRDGYRIIARNWQCREGELDIVAFSICDMVPTLAVVEVRARATDYFGSPLESVTLAKQKKLRITTKKFLTSESRIYGAVRFDVASVLGTKIEVLENAF